MNSYSDLHSQRPEYQRENIDLALKIVSGIISKLGLNSIDFDPDDILI